jgi:YfiH family protein
MEAMKFLTTPRFEVVPGLLHGFGLRVAGSRAAARAASQEAFGHAGQVFFLRQVHGNRVVTPPWSEAPEGDASVTDRTGELLAIETADCLPVLIVDAERQRVAAAHAGWRGTVARVAQAAVKALADAGSDPSRLQVALGPSIGPCCYEVGPKVEEAFGAAGAQFFSARLSGRSHLDVAAANRAQLVEMGIPATSIDHVDACTRCDAERFFSYRRDGANAGRMISVVGFSRSSSSRV